MDSDNYNFQLPLCSNVHPDIAQSSTIIEEGPRICPLCNSMVRPFFINFHEQVLMCENVDCEFPLGHEDLQFIKHNLDFVDDDEASETTKDTGCGTMSVVSTAVWAEIDKINKVYESDDSQFDARLQTELVDRDKSVLMFKKNRENEASIKKTIENIRVMTSELNDKEDDKGEIITDESLINKLKCLQKKFGGLLLKEDEMAKIKKKEPLIGLGELKIDIGDGVNNVSTITIELNREYKSENSP